ncbi:RalBP1-associated Eps domain-containing protein 2 [Cricetulus griseus]|uniref:RalBP1-associated Eps domain-containing protein 2 n=1 Tax=Cricetulus griseus TaxID=10029 RepID=G3I1V6_CRIGR|nr:RalBP1-associated Eps domain-containing protein 2 [Cricetulus griseus]ERE65627.1 ralBP1-associated Eps domain-containing protein 2 [Cricetulus griseus]
MYGQCLTKITELCGAKRVGYFGPTQFYVALKLIAAAQSGLPVRTESIKCELPLPRFGMSKSDGEIRFGNPAELHGKKVQIPYLPTEKNSHKRMDDEDKQRVSLSHGYSKLRSSTEQMHPAPYETRQPIGQPEGSSSEGPGAKPLRRQASLIRSFSVERELQDNNSNYPDEPWRITEEQREYYVNQFRSLQPDPSSFISGSVAKNFFTKSKLSIPELSYIWELSDADCDGALTLPEFCAAFHLIVARKNGYPLPEGLPPTLQPEYLQAECSLSYVYMVGGFCIYTFSLMLLQSEPVSEADLHPQLNRAPSQAAESSPAKKDAIHAQPPSKPIRRKFRSENQTTENQEPAAAVGGAASAAMVKPHPTVQKQSSKQKKAIQTAIRKNKEANAVLARLNSELQQQLKEVHQERIALENQLEQLRPVTVL